MSGVGDLIGFLAVITIFALLILIVVRSGRD